jgi:hypothetical protein
VNDAATTMPAAPASPPRSPAGMSLQALLSKAAKSTDVHNFLQKGVVKETKSDLGGKLTVVSLDNLRIKLVNV